MNEEFRVEVGLDDDEHGYSFGERLRAVDLDDDARARLGTGVMVTRDGSRLFLYAASESEAREAERTVRELVRADELTADIALTRWHPVEEAWKDVSLPLLTTPEAERAEYAAREAAEAEKARSEGSFDWHVVVHLPGRDAAAELADRLSREGVAVRRRWRYVVAGVATRSSHRSSWIVSAPSSWRTRTSASRSISRTSPGRRSSSSRSDGGLRVPGPAPMKRPRVRVGCVVRRGRELLLVRRHGAHGDGTWSTPGGNLGLGEEPARCATRETEEETGVRVGPVRFVGLTNDVLDGQRHYVTLWFEGDHAGGDPSVRASDELPEVGWFVESSLPEPLFQPFGTLLAGGALR